MRPLDLARASSAQPVPYDAGRGTPAATARPRHSPSAARVRGRRAMAEEVGIRQPDGGQVKKTPFSTRRAARARIFLLYARSAPYRRTHDVIKRGLHVTGRCSALAHCAKANPPERRVVDSNMDIDWDVYSPPNSFVCPVSGELMADPVTCVDGHSYEKECILRWFRESRVTSPVTGIALDSATVFPNHALRNAIEEWKLQLRGGGPPPDGTPAPLPPQQPPPPPGKPANNPLPSDHADPPPVPPRALIRCPT